MGKTYYTKLRRHSGRTIPRIVKGFNKKDLIEQGLEPQETWDDWQDYRDGFRGHDDRKQLRNPNMTLGRYFNVKHWNKKLTRLILRRKAKKNKAKNLKA